MSPDVKDWYSPWEIQFKPEHIDWIAEHYEILSSGRYPLKQSGYIDNPFAPPSKNISARAPFETPMLIIAEFNYRLEKCGSDGELFLCLKCLHYEETRILKITRLSPESVDRILGRVRLYISGRRKSRPYTTFIRHYHNGYRQKVGEARHKTSPLFRGLDK